MSSPGAPHFTGTAPRSLIPRAEPSDKSYDSCKLVLGSELSSDRRSHSSLQRSRRQAFVTLLCRRSNTDRAYRANINTYLYKFTKIVYVEYNIYP